MKYNGELVNVNGHNIHIYRLGNEHNPKIVLMSGSGTVAPVYDFKILYEKLSKSFRVIVVEKFGYGYSDIFDSSAAIDTLVSMQKKALQCEPYFCLSAPALPKYISSQTAESSVTDSTTASFSNRSTVALPSKRR